MSSLSKSRFSSGKKQINFLVFFLLIGGFSMLNSSCNSTADCKHEDYKTLKAELQKYKDEEAKVKRNIALMTKADVSMNARDWDGFNSVHTHDVVVTSPDHDGPVTNKADHLAVVQSFVNAFPDHKIEQPYVYIFGSGDYVCAVHNNGGTFTEPWILEGSGATAQPNGKYYSLQMATIATVRDDTLSSEMIIYDMTQMMRQLEIDGASFKMPN